MRKVSMLFCLIAVLALSSGSALAQNIKGKLGVTGLVGFTIPADSDFGIAKVETDAGLIGGGGFIYGIDKNFAGELNITHTQFGSNNPLGGKTGDFEVINISLGGQYRFAVDQPNLVPYVGAGLDILLSDFELPNGLKQDVDTTVGLHASGGIDYFVTKNLALTAEVKILVAPETDINNPSDGKKSGNFNPSSVSGLFGARFFFN